jgi:hypothetical protein
MRIVTWYEFHNLNSVKHGGFFFFFFPLNLVYQNFGNFSSINIEKLIKFIIGRGNKSSQLFCEKTTKVVPNKTIMDGVALSGSTTKLEA